MGPNQTFLIVLIIAIIALAVIAIFMTRLANRDKQFYDERWRIYNPEKPEKKGKKQ